VGWLSPLGPSITNWPIVPAPGDRWWVWSSRWNENSQGKPKYSEKISPVPLCSPQIPHNLTWARTQATAVGSLSYGTAPYLRRLVVCFLPQRPRWGHLRFVMDEVALGRVSPRVFRPFLLIFSPPAARYSLKMIVLSMLCSPVIDNVEWAT
jgi:hypothetical protein